MYVKDMQLQRKIYCCRNFSVYFFFNVTRPKRSSFVHNYKTFRHSLAHLYIHLKFVVSCHVLSFERELMEAVGHKICMTVSLHFKFSSVIFVYYLFTCNNAVIKLTEII